MSNCMCPALNCNDKTYWYTCTCTWREREREGGSQSVKPDLDPVLAVVGSHQSFQVVTTVVTGWPLINPLGGSGQNSDWNVAVEKTQPLQKKLSRVFNSLHTHTHTKLIHTHTHTNAVGSYIYMYIHIAILM